MSSANLSIQQSSHGALLDLVTPSKPLVGNDGNMVKFTSFLNDLFQSQL